MAIFTSPSKFHFNLLKGGRDALLEARIGERFFLHTRQRRMCLQTDTHTHTDTYTQTHTRERRVCFQTDRHTDTHMIEKSAFTEDRHTDTHMIEKSAFTEDRHTDTHMHPCTYTCTHARTHRQTDRHTRTHAHTHTHGRRLPAANTSTGVQRRKVLYQFAIVPIVTHIAGHCSSTMRKFQ